MAIEGIIGKKVGMTQVFAEDGALVPVTVKNLRVAKVDAENNLLYVRGAVPGGRNGLVVVRFSKNGKRGE